MNSQWSRQEPKLLYRRLDSLFGALDQTRPQRRLLESFLEDLVKVLKDDLRISSALLYGEKRDRFALLKNVAAADQPVARHFAPTLPFVTLLANHRVYIFDDPAQAETPAAKGLLPRRSCAGLMLGKSPHRYVFFFLLDEGWNREELDFVLNTVRAALASRLIEDRARGTFREAAEIQQSLLVQQAPAFPGFEIAFRSIPTEEVGGDFFDFVPFGDDTLGVSIGDASGHGLPAALLVRDVVTGLRMGLEKDMKAGYVFSKLNRVIHRSNLSSRFISVFYGELESDGAIFYVNAGHQPPVLFSAHGTEELSAGGTVIGPLPEARFKRGFARLEPGAVLFMCTDGIVERRNAAGELLGVERTNELVREAAGCSAQEILERVFQTTFDYGAGTPWEDDATAVIIKRVS